MSLPVYFQNHSDGSVAWNWVFDNHDSSTDNAPNTTFDTWGWHEVRLVAINEIGCTDTLWKTIFIKPEFYFYAPNTFTPDSDAFNSTYSVSVIGAVDFDFMILAGDISYANSNHVIWDRLFTMFDNIELFRTKVSVTAVIVITLVSDFEEQELRLRFLSFYLAIIYSSGQS